MDIFMTSIEHITSRKKKIYAIREDLPEFLHMKVWNETVANLVLLAIGTSAPEILLSLIEIIGHGFNVGYLGPGTMIGSSAVNIVVVAWCIAVIRKGETRRIKYINVFLVTGFFHIFAHIWLYIILGLITPNVIDVWESLLTLAFFPLMVLIAYAASKGWWMRRLPSFLRKMKGDESEKEFAEARIAASFVSCNRDGIVHFIRQVKQYPGMTVEDAAILAAAKVADAQSHSPVWYKIGGVRVLTSARPITSTLSDRLKEVYAILNEESTLGPELKPPRTPETREDAIVEFEVPLVAVKEAAVDFPVYISRTGNMENYVQVRVSSIDGMAIHGEDYYPVNDIVSFEPNQSRAEITIRIIDEEKYEPTEEFFLRLSVVVPAPSKVKIGRISVMEIKILHDESPGVIEFEKRGIVVKESDMEVDLILIRKNGSDGEVSVKWTTIDQTAKSGVDYIQGNGVVVFKNSELRKSINIQIANTMSDKKEVYFMVKIYEPEGGAILGVVKEMKVIITDDDDLFDFLDNFMFLTNFKLNQMQLHGKNWCQRIRDAMLPNGGRLETATNLDYLTHFLFFFWKVLFSFVPPPDLFGGWLCFIISILGVALLITLAGDMATIFGCIVGFHDAFTAMTVVSIGTSWPDAFACRFALLHGKYADDAIGNINGTGALHVFLGLGLPWTLATIYHASKGNQFIVPSAGLGVMVLMYVFVCTFALSLLYVRRTSAFFGNAEIGGPLVGRVISILLLLMAWSIFTVLSFLDTHGYIHLLL